MSELIHILLAYADQSRIPALLSSTDYTADSRRIDAHWKAFEAELSPGQRDRLEDLLEQEQHLNALDAEAVFRSGLSLGLELSRL